MTYKTAEERAAYAREWRAKNPERAREIDGRKRARKKEEDYTWAYRKTKRWRENNPEKALAQALRQSARIAERTKNDPAYREERTKKRAEYLARPGIRERRRKQWKEWAQASRYLEPEKERARNLKKLYGLTPEQYNAMLAAQGSCCALCGTDKPTGRGQYLSVDHCHNSDKIRELLCHGCNTGLGAFKDDIELLRKAIAYLERHRS